MGCSNNDEEFNYKEEEDEENNGFLKLRKRIHNSIDETEVDDLNTTVRCITLYSHRRRSHRSTLLITFLSLQFFQSFVLCYNFALDSWLVEEICKLILLLIWF